MKTINIHKTPPFLANVDNIVVSRTGDISYCYEILLPEKHSLSETGYDSLLDVFVKAFRNFEKNTIIHKSDFYMKSKFNVKKLPDESYLQKTFKNHHSKKFHTVHKSYLFFTNTISDFINKDDISNPFSRISNAEELIKEATNNVFKETVINCVDYVNKKKKAYIKPLDPRSIEDFSRSYFNGLLQGVYTDVDGTKAKEKEGIKIGERSVDVYTVNSLSQLPAKLTNITVDPDVAKEGVIFYQGLTEPFGISLPYDHVVNQILYLPIQGRLLKAAKKKQEEFFASRGFGLNAKPAEKIRTWIDSVMDDKANRLIKAHFNVIVFTDDKRTRDEARSFTKALFTDNDITPYMPTGNALNAIYQQSFFPFSSQLPNRFSFVCDIRLACSFLIPTSGYRSDKNGIWFSDRVFSAPLKKDTWDDEKKRIKAKNFFIVAPTGEGKSTLSNHICYQYLDQKDTKLVISDLGKSYQNLYRMYKNRSVMLEYNPGQKLGINPFMVDDPNNIDSDSILYINDIINLFHFKGSIMMEDVDKHYKGHNTCLRKIISAFYETVDEHNIQMFYKFFEYIHKQNRYEEIGVDPSLYNAPEKMGEVIFSLSEFVDGGLYSFLFELPKNDKELFRIDPSIDFAYFEFDKAGKDPLLQSILQLYSFEATRKVIWEDKTVKGVQLYDEYAKQLKNKQIQVSSEYIAQAIRKQNGACGFVIQSVAQLPTNDTIASILDNTSVFYILPNDDGHQVTADRLRLPEHHRFLLDSIESDFSAKVPYSEVFLKLGAYATVVRVQLPKEHFYTFQTEGHLYDTVNNAYKKYGSMELAINDLTKN